MRMREDELTEIEELCAAATPGPWFVRSLDDEHAMNLVAVSVVPDDGAGARWPDFDHREIVAATLVQQPRCVDSGDERWDENAAFIAMARQAVPRLVAEIRRLRSQQPSDAAGAVASDAAGATSRAAPGATSGAVAGVVAGAGAGAGAGPVAVAGAASAGVAGAA
ncbi:hypothetical protein [Micromonospora zingiberis]|uniref:hypothetical protein n=1 Tax=Micromonospora zingiberis TaxID=2053011 RepID=UPI00198234CF|nr:hypothetical protein [Micromonospora zingiberis]